MMTAEYAPAAPQQLVDEQHVCPCLGLRERTRGSFATASFPRQSQVLATRAARLCGAHEKVVHQQDAANDEEDARAKF